jgi:hypothetical protein
LPQKSYKKHLPELWGGEVGLLADAHINKGNGFTDTPSITSTSSKQYHVKSCQNWKINFPA